MLKTKLKIFGVFKSYISIILVVFCLLFSSFIVIGNASAKIEYNHCWFPTADNGVVIGQSPIYPPYIMEIKSDSANIKALSGSYSNAWYPGNNKQYYAMSWGFKTEGGPGINYGVIPNVDAIHVNITKVELYMVTQTNSPINSGYFSFCVDYPNDNNPNVDWVKQYGTWIDSSLFPYTVPPEWMTTVYKVWNVTFLHAFTVDELVSDYSFRVMWTFTSNWTHQYIDYVGVKYSYTYDNLTDVFNTPNLIFSSNLYSLVWLLIMFTPAIAMSQYVPKIGFIAGITLMLIIIGVTQSGFIPTMVIGILGISVLLYKGI